MSNKSQWSSELEILVQERHRIDKKIDLLNELISLEDGVPVKASASSRKADKKRGRPRREDDTEATTDTSKTMKLPALLTSIGQQCEGPIKIADLTKRVIAAGYETNSDKPENMVYQCLQKLIKKGVFTKDQETREYTFNGVCE